MSFIKHSRSDYIETITISRPDKLNALSPELLQELTGVFRSLLEQPEPYLVTLAIEITKIYIDWNIV